MPPEVAMTFAEPIRALSGVLTAEKPVYALRTFTFLMFASMSVLTDEPSEVWEEIDNHLSTNMHK
jgi:hypothetical protein